MEQSCINCAMFPCCKLLNSMLTDGIGMDELIVTEYGRYCKEYIRH